MKIALCQMDILFEQKQENYGRAGAWMKQAAGQGAELILFPEMSFTGFSMHTELTAEKEQETVRTMQEMAISYGIGVGFGWVKAGNRKEKEIPCMEGKPDRFSEDNRNRAENHYTVISSTGEILSDYTKIHPFRYSGEHLYFQGGDTLSGFSFGNLRIGTLICYDLRFPEAFQVLAEDCDAIIVPANWPESRREHWKCLLQARSIECQTYILGINCCGMQEGLNYTGDSCVFTPDGKLIAGFQEGEGLVMAEILPDVERYRESFPVRQDRKWNLYDQWYEKIQ